MNNVVLSPYTTWLHGFCNNLERERLYDSKTKSASTYRKHWFCQTLFKVKWLNSKQMLWLQSAAYVNERTQSCFFRCCNLLSLNQKRETRGYPNRKKYMIEMLSINLEKPRSSLINLKVKLFNKLPEKVCAVTIGPT